MQPRPNHTEEEVGSVILQRPAKDLLVNRDSSCPLDTTKSMDGRSYAQISNTLNIDGDFGLCGWPLWVALGRDLREPNPDGANIASKDVTTVKCLPCPHCII